MKFKTEKYLVWGGLIIGCVVFWIILIKELLRVGIK